MLRGVWTNGKEDKEETTANEFVAAGRPFSTKNTKIALSLFPLNREAMTERHKMKTITIKEATWKRLKNAGVMGDTFDSLINRALDCYEGITVR